MLAIHAFGPLRVTLDGKQLPLPASKKTRALLGFLALTHNLQRRERLCELFWEIPDDPRGALRWSLSKLRPVVNSDETTRLFADRERVQLHLDDLTVDFLDVRAIANGNEASVDALEAAWETSQPTLM
ncbi:MAG: hypothetical protein WA989_14425, partial [Henriciella sp.]|uniref:AfsR/SARP family transcriptional regulator n=1 Tax=Henriciella sp. TaxID=1968823 RepID=UPI003C75A8BF